MDTAIKTPESALKDLNTRNGITYVMQAVTSSGDILAKYTSNISFDDLAGFAFLADETMSNFAILEQNIKEELDNE